MKLKKTICILVFLSVVLITGCYQADKGNVVLENAQYAIIEDNRMYSLRFYNNEMKDSLDSASGSVSPRSISFVSVGEMKECIEKGKFSKTDLLTMQYFAKNSRGEITICNLNRLFDATLPNDVPLDGVTWYGQTYTLGFGGKYTGRIQFCSQDYYDQEVARYKYENNPKLEIISKTSVEDRDATVYVCRNRSNDLYFRDIQYTYTNGDKTIFFVETYNFSELYADTPTRIYFFGYMHGQYFCGSISGFRQRPSYEWLQAFGLTPYEEKETE